MRRRAFIAAGLACALPLPATGAAAYTQGLLWRVHKAGVEPSHVFGTLHADDPRLEPLPATVQEAFGQARALMLEYLADQYGRERFLEAALYLDGRTLAQDIGAAHFERAVQAMQPIGLTRAFVGKLKPWGVLLNLRISRQPAGATPPDAQLFALARARRLPVSQIGEPRAQPDRAPILVDRFMQRTGLGIGIAQRGVLIGQPAGHRPGEPAVGRVIGGPGGPKRFGGFLAPPQLVQDDPAVQVGLHVPRVDLQGPLEFLEGAFPLPEEGKGEPEKLMGIGESAALRQQLLQEMHRAVVILHRKAIARLRQQVLGTHMHK